MGVLMGKSSINGPFSMAMLDNQRIIHPFINGTVPLNIRVFCQSPVWKSVVSPPNISKFWPYRCSFFLHIQPMSKIDRGAKKNKRGARQDQRTGYCSRELPGELAEKNDKNLIRGATLLFNFMGNCVIWDTCYNMGYICYNMLYIYIQ